MRRVANVAVHTAAGLATAWLSLLVALPSPEAAGAAWWRALPWLAAIRFACFSWSGVSLPLWRYASIWDVRDLLLSIAAGSTLFAAACWWSPALRGHPVTAVALDAIFLTGVLAGTRLAVRLIASARRSHDALRRVLVFGAGDAGEMIVRDMRRDGRYRPVAFVDDDPAKRGRRIHGLPVLGGRDRMRQAIEGTSPDELLIAMPSAAPEVLRDVLRALEPFSLPIRTLPSLRHLMSGKVTVGHIHDLAVEDLLPRSEVGLDSPAARALIAGRRVLVTGAGGSIGSELCRQVAAFEPAALVLLDRYENGLHAAVTPLEGRVGVRPVVADITDADVLERVFATVRPDIVFHAAAHKHVPLMETNLCEAVRNNVTGTRLVAEAAVRHGASRFVFISTDKAVDPVSVMGATKCLGERLLRRLAHGRSDSPFVMVRFGNVLGSNGSVLPLFVEQVRAGGPVTVTHPEVRRYFMLIPEAVQLVLHAAAHATGGRTCVLDMGEPMKVVDLARHVIRLAGFVPEEEIPIVFTGLRPGEKLSERLIAADERHVPSGTPEISWVETPGPADGREFDGLLASLESAAAGGDESRAGQLLWRAVYGDRAREAAATA